MNTGAIYVTMWENGFLCTFQKPRKFLFKRKLSKII